VLWAFLGPEALWPLAFDAAFCGTLMAGQALAAFNLPLSLAPRDERPFHVAAFCTAGGVATLAASVGGTLWVQALPPSWSLFGSPRIAFHALFFASAAGRAGAAVLGARIAEPGARSWRSLLPPLRRLRLEARPR
jgi:hypothetical protein